MLTIKLTYKQYATLTQFAFGEELERIGEFMRALESPDQDVSDDKPWTVDIETVPSKDKLEELVAACGVPLDLLMRHAEEFLEGEGDEEEQEAASDAIRSAWMES